MQQTKQRMKEPLVRTLDCSNQRRLLPELICKGKSLFIYPTILSWSCMQRCRRNGSMPSPQPKRSPHIQSQGIEGSTSHTVGIATLYIRDIRLGVGVGCTQSYDVHNASRRLAGGTCGCAMQDSCPANRAVRFSNGLNWTKTVIRFGHRKNRART